MGNPGSDDLREKPELTAGAQNPVENVWLIPLDSGLKALAGFLQLFRERRLKHTILLLEGQLKIWE